MSDRHLSVVIIDDHALFRNGLQQLLSSRDINVVGMTGNPTEAIDLINLTEPDVVLLDLRMKELTGLQVLVKIKDVMPSQCVVILTTSVEEDDLMEALRLGAMGYLLKDMEIDVLVQLLQQAKNGDTVVALGIVDGTVKLHVRAVLKKLKVQSRVQAAVLAISENMFDDLNGDD